MSVKIRLKIVMCCKLLYNLYFCYEDCYQVVLLTVWILRKFTLALLSRKISLKQRRFCSRNYKSADLTEYFLSESKFFILPHCASPKINAVLNFDLWTFDGAMTLVFLIEFLKWLKMQRKTLIQCLNWHCHRVFLIAFEILKI